ncbi:MAG TPA: hypothetical protein DDX04_13755 [Massilia sp.]|nr:hypothetical protein [Massilia sp.]
MKRLGKGLLALLAALALYLAIAAGWAAAAFDELLVRWPQETTPAALSPRQAAILLRIEDPTFYSHPGLSLADGQGVATISSALAREFFLEGPQLDGTKGLLQRFYRRVFDCCKRVDFGRDITALVLDARLPKERQLAMYVQSVYLGRYEGRQVRGLAQAAQAYFGKPLAQLDDAESAGLVAMIKAPNAYHPEREPTAYALRLARVQAVLDRTCRPAGWFDTDYAHCAAAK